MPGTCYGVEMAYSPTSRAADSEREIPAALMVTLKRTIKPKKKDDPIRWEDTIDATKLKDSNFPGIR